MPLCREINILCLKINSNFFDNKIVLITGASRGIGKAILQQFAQNNATVIGTATSDSGAEAISQYLQQNNFKGCGVKLDVADSQNIQTVIDFISKNYGNISKPKKEKFKRKHFIIFMFN